MSEPENHNFDGATERLRAEMEKGFGGLHAEIGAVRNEIGSVRSEVGTLRTEIGAVRSEVGTLRTEIGAARLEIGSVHTEMEKGLGALRAEMIDRDAGLLKWFLVYAVTQTGVIAALLKLLR